MFDFLILNALQSRKTEQLENISAYISCILGILLISALELAGHQNTPDIYDLPAGIIASLLYSLGRLSVIKNKYTADE